MPELPEVETIRNGLSRFVLFKEIRGIFLFDPKIFFGSKKELKKIEGDKFSKVERLGKALVFSFKKSENKMIVHLKMTGQLVYFIKEKNSNLILTAGGHSEKEKSKLSLQDFKHLRFKISFSDGGFLILNDTRKFAYLKLLNSDDLEKMKKRLGIEPLSSQFTLKFFLQLTENKKKNVKAFLLDQKYISGIGNIYADEILFASRVNPNRRVSSLNFEEKKRIYQNIKRILKLAVKKRGTTFNDYVDASGQSGGFLPLLKVYGRKGQKCKVCGGLISKTRLAGRGTHYCPKCQC